MGAWVGVPVGSCVGSAVGSAVGEAVGSDVRVAVPAGSGVGVSSGAGVSAGSDGGTVSGSDVTDGSSVGVNVPLSGVVMSVGTPVGSITVFPPVVSAGVPAVPQPADNIIIHASSSDVSAAPVCLSLLLFVLFLLISVVTLRRIVAYYVYIIIHYSLKGQAARNGGQRPVMAGAVRGTEARSGPFGPVGAPERPRAPGGSLNMLSEALSGAPGASCFAAHFRALLPEISGYSRKCPAVPGNFRTFPGVPGRYRKFPDIPEIALPLPEISECFRAFRETRKCAAKQRTGLCPPYRRSKNRSLSPVRLILLHSDSGIGIIYAVGRQVRTNRTPRRKNKV